MHNASGDNIISKFLGQAMKNKNATFAADHQLPCIAHVLNLAVQEGLQQLDIEPAPTEDELANQIIEAANGMTMTSNQHESTLSMLLVRLRQAITLIKMSSRRITQYQVMCEELGMESDHDLGVDCSMSWNSTLDMLCAAISQRRVLDKMAKEVLNTSKQNYSITEKEWELLEIFAHVLWPFRDGIEVLRSSKQIYVSRVMPIAEGLLQLLKENMTSLDREAKAPESSLTTKQWESLKGTYDIMMVKLMKYRDILKRNPAYMIATALDPQIKLTSTLPINHPAIHIKLLFLLNDVERSRHHEVPHETIWDKATTPGRLGNLRKLPNRLSMILSGVEPPSKHARVTAENEVKEYFNQACVIGDPLMWWGQVGCFRYPKLARLAKEYLSIRVTCTLSEHPFAAWRASDTFKRDSIKGKTTSVLMTLKCWAQEEGEEKVLCDEHERPAVVET